MARARWEPVMFNRQHDLLTLAAQHPDRQSLGESRNVPQMKDDIPHSRQAEFVERLLQFPGQRLQRFGLDEQGIEGWGVPAAWPANP
jgi:hypothetical protein